MLQSSTDSDDKDFESYGPDEEGNVPFNTLLLRLRHAYELSDELILKALRASDTKKHYKLNSEQYKSALDYLDSLVNDYSPSEPEVNISKEFNNLDKKNRSQSF